MSVVSALRAAGCVFAEEEAALLTAEAHSAGDLDAMVARRISGEPLEYIVGWAGFCGMRIGVDAGVFVPRRRTEFLIAVAGSLLPVDPIVVDICCGSGALGIALVAGKGGTLYAADLDPAAVACARRNVAELLAPRSLRGQVYEGDLFDPLPPSLMGSVDILLANAPYVPSGEIRLMPAEARDYEHLVTLDGGRDGLDVQRRVIAAAASWLSPQGYLLIETSERQAADTARSCTDHGLTPVIHHDEDLDATLVVAASTALP